MRIEYCATHLRETNKGKTQAVHRLSTQNVARKFDQEPRNKYTRMLGEWVGMSNEEGK